VGRVEGAAEESHASLHPGQASDDARHHAGGGTVPRSAVPAYRRGRDVQELPVIRHLVFFTARDPADLPRMRATLATLATIPGVRGFEVGVNTRHDRIDAEDRGLEGGDGVDLVVHAVFDDDAALAAYTAHPVYQRSVAVVRPLRETRIAVDYVVDGPAPPPPPPT
jgi:hypothetical protein